MPTPQQPVEERKCDGCSTFKAVGVHSFRCPIRDMKIEIGSQPTEQSWWTDLIGDLRVSFPEIYSVRHNKYADEFLKKKIEGLLSLTEERVRREILTDLLTEKTKVPPVYDAEVKIQFASYVRDYAKSIGITLNDKEV